MVPEQNNSNVPASLAGEKEPIRPIWSAEHGFNQNQDDESPANKDKPAWVFGGCV